MELAAVDRIVDKYHGDGGALIAILQDIQEECNYIPEDVALRLTEKMDIPLSRAYSLATFFNAFSLTPRGEHPISVCMGTACHVRGALRILEKIERDLDVKTGGTTEDLQFGLEAVRCLGCCGLAPVITVGEDLYGKISLTRVPRILKKYQGGGAGE